MDNQRRSLTDIAEEIIRDWNPPSYSAQPFYLPPRPTEWMRKMKEVDK